MTNEQVPKTSSSDSIDAKLYGHPVYEHYSNIHGKHAEENPICGKVVSGVETELMANSLKGEDKIVLRSQTLFVISDKFLQQFDDIAQLEAQDKNNSYTFFHLGDRLSGHPRIVHGGFIATVLDELTCDLGIKNFESKKAVTANLNINYRQPCYTNTYIVVKCLLMERKGRKCVVRGEIYLLDLDLGIFDPNDIESQKHLLSECLALIIEPKFAIESK